MVEAASPLLLNYLIVVKVKSRFEIDLYLDVYLDLYLDLYLDVYEKMKKDIYKYYINSNIRLYT